MTKLFISEDGFIKAEAKAESLNIPISEAVHGFESHERGEIEIISAEETVSSLRPRQKNSHKGTFGRAVIIAGSERFPGAAQISALAALRSGAGLVSVITTRLAAQAAAVSAKEATYLPMPCDSQGFISPEQEHKEAIAETVRAADALLIGPGLGVGRGCLDVLKIALKNADCPIILDADGINLVCGRIELLRKAKSGLILTPHPIELSRLTGADAADMPEKRLSLAKELSAKLGCVTVSKSCGTLIVSKDSVYLSCRGNDGLAKGGSGDFLAGLITSFAAQGYSSTEAAAIGVAVQGLACEAVTETFSTRSVLVSDMIGSLPLLFKKFERRI